MSETTLAVIPQSLTPSTMDEAIAFADRMANARLLPAHLQKSPADCLRVVLQAVRWQMDPFAVADKTSIISGKLMYEGQLVSAVVNARGNLSARLNYEFRGEGDNRVLIVSGTIRGENEPRTIELPFALARKINKNGQMNINPDQQATYIGARIWARRHMPELMLGVYTPDEMDEDGEKNVTPTEPVKRDEAPKKAATTGAAGAAEEKKTRGKPKPAGDGKVVEGDFQMAEKANLPALTLADKESRRFVCRVVEFTTSWIDSGGTSHPSVRATLDGGFTGKVVHLGGASANPTDASLPPIALPQYQLEKPVEFRLVGKARKPKLVEGKEVAQPPAILVESVKLAEEPAATPPAEEKPATPAASESVD